jgi:two-component system chemotaxis sensor kinase CheA
MSADSLPDEIIQRFRQLAVERLTRAESIWFALLQDTSNDGDAAELLRLVHTLKGDALVVGFTDVDLVCHKLEDLLTVASDMAYAVPDDLDLLVTMSFHFIGLLTRKRAGTAVAGIDLDGFVREVDQAVLAARAVERSPHAAPEGSPGKALDDRSSDRGARLARAATIAFLEHLGASGASRQRLHELWQMLQQEVARASSAVLGHIVERHIEAANHLCEQLGKLVDIDVDTHGLSVTERVADALDIGLLHCIRNAVDHGIESPDERLAAAKPLRGAIRITAELEGDVVEIVVEDDGRGFDHEAIALRASETGLVDEALELVFQPGFSTAKKASRVSGRGVGLDAVRSALRKVGGEVTARDRPGGGARIVMRVPARMQHMQLHVFEARPGLRLAIPAQWTVTADVEPRVPVVDPLAALGVVERATSPAEHVVMLRQGALHACYTAATSPRLATAHRICPTAATDPMEVVTVQSHEVLVLRPDQLPGAARACALHSDERSI